VALEIEHYLREGGGAIPPEVHVERLGSFTEIHLLHRAPADADQFERRVPREVRRQLSELGRMQGGREIRFALAPSVEGELLERTAKAVAHRIERLTRKGVLASVAGRTVIVDLPGATLREWKRVELDRAPGAKLLSLL